MGVLSEKENMHKSAHPARTVDPRTPKPSTSDAPVAAGWAKPSSSAVREVTVTSRNAGLESYRRFVRATRGQPAGVKNTRRAARMPVPLQRGVRAATQATAPSDAGRSSGKSDDEMGFRWLIVRIGLARASELLAELRQRFDGVVSGL